MKNITKTWKGRSLRQYGNVAVIKSLVMSKITHLLLALTCPDKNMVNEFENVVFDSLWRGNTPRYRKEIIEAEIKEGGMKLLNLMLF